MTTRLAPICLGCKFFDAAAPTLVCDAFPKGIPEPIIRNEADHRKPYRGDNGTQFEAETPADARYADEVLA